MKGWSSPGSGLGEGTPHEARAVVVLEGVREAKPAGEDPQSYRAVAPAAANGELTSCLLVQERYIARRV